MEGEVCIANIGPRQRRARLLGGVVAAVATVLFAWILVFYGLPRTIRLTVFLPSFLAALGFLQYREKT